MRLAIRGSAVLGDSMPRGASGCRRSPARGAGQSLAAVDRRHTRRVAVLKRVLPAVGVSLLLLIAMWPRLVPLWERMRCQLPGDRSARRAGIAHGQPALLGNRPTGKAVRRYRRLGTADPRSPGSDVAAGPGRRYQVAQRRRSRAPAPISAVYQSQAEHARPVRRRNGDAPGRHPLRHASARVNAAKNTAEGSDPVSGHGPAGDIKAQGFRIIDKGDTILFTGKAEMLLNAAERPPRNARPPALPAPVAATRVASRGRGGGSRPRRHPGKESRGGLRRKPPPASRAHTGARDREEALICRTVAGAAHRSRIGRTALAIAIAACRFGGAAPGLAQIGFPDRKEATRTDPDPGRFRDRVAARPAQSISPAAMPSRRAATARCTPTR